MKKEIKLYHGSHEIINLPIKGKGNKFNDYGYGFYCTESIELAKEWAVSNNIDGYANKYILDTSDLKILNLSSKEYNVLHWITILLLNRKFELKNEISQIGKEYLINNYSIPYEDFDIIIGYRADDSYFAFAESFLNNTISVQRLSEAMRLGNLGEQIVLISEKAFSKISFIGYEIADANLYYSLREYRNESARKAFLENKKGENILNALYLADIIRGGIKNNDPRIQ